MTSETRVIAAECDRPTYEFLLSALVEQFLTTERRYAAKGIMCAMDQFGMVPDLRVRDCLWLMWQIERFGYPAVVAYLWRNDPVNVGDNWDDANSEGELDDDELAF